MGFGKERRSEDKSSVREKVANEEKSRVEQEFEL
jgi:hypothetical protein